MNLKDVRSKEQLERRRATNRERANAVKNARIEDLQRGLLMMRPSHIDAAYAAERAQIDAEYEAALVQSQEKCPHPSWANFGRAITCEHCGIFARVEFGE